MKLFLTSNTNFGYKQYLTSKQWLQHMSSYFEDELLSTIHFNASKEDIFVHLGNLFVNQNISLNSFNKVIRIFEKLSKIIPCYFLINQNDINSEDYDVNTLNILRNIPNVHIITEKILVQDILFIPYTTNLIKDLEIKGKVLCFNFDYQNHSGEELIVDSLKNFQKSFCGYYSENKTGEIIDIGSPYQLDKSSSKFGITIYDVDKDKMSFVENQMSPKFKTLKVEKSEDLKVTNNISNDVTEVIVDNDFFEKNKILVDIFINKHDINKVLFKDSSREVERVPIDINSENFNLNDLIFDRIKGDDKLTKEFEKILEIYKGKDK